jgi:hypothetical protein
MVDTFDKLPLELKAALARYVGSIIMSSPPIDSQLNLIL